MSTAANYRGVALAAAFILAIALHANSAEPGPRPGLQPLALTPLPLGRIQARGWLEKQLRAQADGLTGHLDEFWPDVRDSAWIGGRAEGWERMPYWLDGAVPLAFVLDDGPLKAKVRRHIDTILDRQQPDGWLGPIGDATTKHKPYDVWPLFVLFKALTQYEEATGDPRVVPAMLRAARKIDAVITDEPLYRWARFRAADLVVGLDWLYGRTGDPWLIGLSDKAFRQGHDWAAQFADLAAKQKVPRGQSNLSTHGVNIGMGLKYGPERWRHSGATADREVIGSMLAQLDRYHGQANGLFTCDEHLAGRNPSQGSELCTVVEAMFALERAVAILGEARLADRLERLAFNALPATITADFNAHQYDQQANQVACRVCPEPIYGTNGPDANLFGLEPNFGCCTANLHQGWPKFTAHLWMTSPDGGLAAVAYAPCAIEAEVGGRPVRVEVRTDYPFRDEVSIVVEATGDAPARFPIHLRIPSWTEGATIDGEAPAGVGRSGGFARVEADWAGGRTIQLRLPMPVRLVEGLNDAVAIRRGPLTFALKVGSDWRKIVDRDGLPFDDWEVLPTTPWNYAIRIDRQDPGRSISFETLPIGDRPFTPAGAPVVARVDGRIVPEWVIEQGAAAAPPPSPARSDRPLESLTLIPYGSTDLRITEFPTLPERD